MLADIGATRGLPDAAGELGGGQAEAARGRQVEDAEEPDIGGTARHAVGGLGRVEEPLGRCSPRRSAGRYTPFGLRASNTSVGYFTPRHAVLTGIPYLSWPFRKFRAFAIVIEPVGDDPRVGVLLGAHAGIGAAIKGK